MSVQDVGASITMMYIKNQRTTYSADNFVAEPFVLQVLNVALHEHLGLQAPYLAAYPSLGHPELHEAHLVQKHLQAASYGSLPGDAEPVLAEQAGHVPFLDAAY